MCDPLLTPRAPAAPSPPPLSCTATLALTGLARRRFDSLGVERRGHQGQVHQDVLPLGLLCATECHAHCALVWVPEQPGLQQRNARSCIQLMLCGRSLYLVTWLYGHPVCHSLASFPTVVFGILCWSLAPSACGGGHIQPQAHTMNNRWRLLLFNQAQLQPRLPPCNTGCRMEKEYRCLLGPASSPTQSLSLPSIRLPSFSLQQPLTQQHWINFLLYFQSHPTNRTCESVRVLSTNARGLKRDCRAMPDRRCSSLQGDSLPVSR